MRAPITATMVLVNRGWCNAVTALVLVTVTPNANAVTTKWTVQPELTVTETYSDNALFTSSSARGDFTTLVTPGIRIEGSGARFNADLSYTRGARRHPAQAMDGNHRQPEGHRRLGVPV